MARTFRATLAMSQVGGTSYGRVPIEATIVDELGLRPGETVRASMRNTEFSGTVHGSLSAPNLLIPTDVLRSLDLREGQGVRVTILGRA